MQAASRSLFVFGFPTRTQLSTSAIRLALLLATAQRSWICGPLKSLMSRVFAEPWLMPVIGQNRSEATDRFPAVRSAV